MLEIDFISIHQKNGSSISIAMDQLMDYNMNDFNSDGFLFAVINYTDGRYCIAECLGVVLKLLKVL
ncbi:hypothetical protein E9993_20810 [Labilibacter sediminis]|nr:hypothetical protein E9993_20810 [Labilibacter sediminis]